MFDRLRNAWKVGLHEWRYGEESRRCREEFMQKREAARKAAWDALSPPARRFTKDPTEDGLAAYFGEVSAMPLEAQLEALKFVFTKHPELISAPVAKEWAMQNSEEMAALAKRSGI